MLGMEGELNWTQDPLRGMVISLDPIPPTISHSEFAWVLKLTKVN